MAITADFQYVLIMLIWVRGPKKGPKLADVVYHMDGPQGFCFTALQK